MHHTRILLSFLAFSFIATFNVAAVHAAIVQVNFSGGGGTPLTIALPDPTAFTVTTPPFADGVNFVFKSTGNPFGAGPAQTGFIGALKFTINAGAPININSLASGQTIGGLMPTDLRIFNNPGPAVLVGDTVLLSSGSSTTTTNVVAAAPPSGLYTVYLADGNVHRIDAVPEPASLAVIALAAGPIFLRRRTFSRR